jgi:hypothetical protein
MKQADRADPFGDYVSTCIQDIVAPKLPCVRHLRAILEKQEPKYAKFAAMNCKQADHLELVLLLRTTGASMEASKLSIRQAV